MTEKATNDRRRPPIMADYPRNLPSVWPRVTPPKDQIFRALILVV